ncbi:hypothetical protein MMC30_002792 [Trapelia coarctata]|nr:hypothetical protein [Trapelia coarctata]
MATAQSDVEAGSVDSDRSGHESGDGVPAKRVRLYGTVPVEREEPTSAVHDKESNIPPADHGKAAWLFLIGCFWLEGLVWGLPFSFGVFKKYYSNHEIFRSEPGIAAIGTTGLGIAYFAAPVIVIILQRWPSQRRNVSILGLIMLTTGLLVASFATRVVHLILTQGLLYGVGGALLYNPFLFYVDDWFVKRKGLAYGVFWAGTGVCGTAVPLIMEWALSVYGFRITLRAWAAFVFAGLSLLIYFVRPRLPVTAQGVTLSLNLDFIHTAQFWLFQCGSVIEALGYFIPQVYLPSYAKATGFTPLSATLSVSLLNGASTFGAVFIGLLVDRYHLRAALVVSTIGSAISVFLIWGFTVTEFDLYAFALAYGIFAGGYTATWTGCVAEIQKDFPSTETGVMMGIMAAGRGAGSIVSGPISEKLFSFEPGKGMTGAGYGTEYGSLIVFTGITALLGGLGVIGRSRRRGGSKGDLGNTHDESEPLIASSDRIENDRSTFEGSQAK